MVNTKIKMVTNSQSMTDQHFMINIMHTLKFNFNYKNSLMEQLIVEVIELQ